MKMRIVIMGGGFGGINAAVKLKKLLKDPKHQITLITQSDIFCFRPSLVWVPFNERTIEDISLSLQDFIRKEEIEFVVQRVKKIEPSKNIVCLENNTIQYDYLIIATGAKPDYEQVRGLEDHTHSIYYPNDALITKKSIETIKEGDDIVIGVAKGNPNPLPAYEFLFELDAFLKKNKINANLTFITYEEYLIDVAPDNVKKHFIKHFKDKNISFLTNSEIKKVKEKCIILKNDEAVPFSFLLILPPYKGQDYIFKSNLHHNNGLIPVEESLLSIEWDNIYAVGDGCLLPSQQMIKSGWAAELQGEIAAENISSRIFKKQKEKTYKDHMLSLVDLGTDGGLFTFKNDSFQFTFEGTSPHIMKVALEKYYLQKFKG